MQGRFCLQYLASLINISAMLSDDLEIFKPRFEAFITRDELDERKYFRRANRAVCDELNYRSRDFNGLTTTGRCDPRRQSCA